MRSQFSLRGTGYALDVTQLRANQVDEFRAQAWALASIDWGGKDQLLALATTVATQAPGGSLWIRFYYLDHFDNRQTDQVLAIAQGKASLSAFDHHDLSLARRYGLNEAFTEQLRDAFNGDQGQSALELVDGALNPRHWFSSELLTSFDHYRKEGTWYLRESNIDVLREHCLKHDLSMSAALTDLWVHVRSHFINDDFAGLPPKRPQPPNRAVSSSVFLSLQLWFGYELEQVAMAQDRSQSWFLQQTIERTLPLA